MTKQLHISFILDETGSMGSVKEATISGFNEYLDGVKGAEATKDALFTLTKFNTTKVEIVHKDVPLADAKPLTAETYLPSSTTPLFDAIGKTIIDLEAALKDGDHAVLMVIQTDGLENASAIFTQEKIKSMIEEKRQGGWEFVFLGADQDAYLASSAIGITHGNTVAYASADTKQTLGGTTMRGTCAYAIRVSRGLSTEDLFAEPTPADTTSKPTTFADWMKK